MRVYENITLENRASAEEYVRRYLFNRKRDDKPQGEKSRYTIILKDQALSVWISDIEIHNLIECAIDLVEELKKINNSGVGQKYLEKRYKWKMGELNIDKTKALSEEDDEKIWEEVIKDVYTDNILMIKTRMVIVSQNTKEAKFRVVNAFMDFFICRAYRDIVDEFEDIDWYYHIVYFVALGIAILCSEDGFGKNMYAKQL